MNFGETHGVSPLQMVTLLGDIIMDLGLSLECFIEDNTAPQLAEPLARAAKEVVMRFGEERDMPPLRMVGLPGYMVVDLGPSLERYVQSHEPSKRVQ